MTAVDAAYCPTCGTTLEPRVVDGRERRFCPDCRRVVWRNPVPGTQLAVCDADEVLLIRRARDPGRGDWALPGGHMEADESPEVAAVRELEEETGVRIDPDAIQVVGTNNAMLDGERYSVTFGFAAARADAEEEVVAGTDAVEARFVPWDAVDELEVWDYSRPLVDAARAWVAQSQTIR
jgi:8-oxo-dGTP diphosphatase